jgi:hypothetical protein
MMVYLWLTISINAFARLHSRQEPFELFNVSEAIKTVLRRNYTSNATHGLHSLYSRWHHKHCTVKRSPKRCHDVRSIVFKPVAGLGDSAHCLVDVYRQALLSGRCLFLWWEMPLADRNQKNTSNATLSWSSAMASPGFAWDWPTAMKGHFVCKSALSTITNPSNAATLDDEVMLFGGTSRITIQQKWPFRWKTPPLLLSLPPRKENG